MEFACSTKAGGGCLLRAGFPSGSAKGGGWALGRLVGQRIGSLVVDSHKCELSDAGWPRASDNSFMTIYRLLGFLRNLQRRKGARHAPLRRAFARQGVEQRPEASTVRFAR